MEDGAQPTIRPATVDDAAAIAGIYGPVVATSPASFEIEPPSRGEMARRIEQTTRTHPWLVAEGDEGVLGYAYAAPARSRAAYRWAAEVSVYLAPEARGRGVGGALVDELLARLRTAGYVTALAGSTLPNDASVRLFERRGFRLVGVFEKTGFKLGAWHDVGWWQLVLNDDPGPPEEPSPPAAG
jgi:phosphinothricin acetyltransferase